MLETEVYIHVGVPKTGSTFLQKMVLNNIEGFEYYRSHSYLSQRIDMIPNLSISNEIENISTEISEYLITNSIRRLIISNESLFGHPLYNFMNHELIIKNLKHVFPNAKFLILIRRQVDFFESLYKYVVYLGYPISKGDFFQKKQGEFQNWSYNKGLNCSVFSLNYLKLLEMYEQYFGITSLTVIPFEALKESPLEFRFQLENWLGTNLKFWPENSRVNEGMNRAQYLVLRIFNGFFKSSISNGFGIIRRRPFRAAIINKFSRSKIYQLALQASNFVDLRLWIRYFPRIKGTTPYFIFTEDERNYISNYYKKSNMELSEKMNLNLSKFNY